MNNNSCTPYSRVDKECRYHLDCQNTHKMNQVQTPCPAPEQPILNCDVNAPCPVYSCNHKEDLIYKRNFPDDPRPIVPDYRGSYKVCGLYRNKTESSLNNDLRNYIEIINHPQGSLYPGKGSGVEYLKNIDIDTHLRRGKNFSLCPKKN